MAIIPIEDKIKGFSPERQKKIRQRASELMEAEAAHRAAAAFSGSGDHVGDSSAALWMAIAIELRVLNEGVGELVEAVQDLVHATRKNG
jgi:hypothetical protein